MRRLVPLLALVVAAAALALGFARVAAPAALVPPKAVGLSAAGKRALRVDPVQLASDSLTRTAEKLTLRVRNISCSGVAVGSAWALDPHTLVTNRHVLAGASVLEADTWDGESLELSVGDAKTGRLVDIGIATVPETLPQVAKTGPAAKPGDKVTAVGYPLGGKLTLSPGRVVRYLDGRTLDPSIAFDGQVMQLTTKIKHGNSGGPVLDSKGRVVGVIYAGEPGATEQDYVKTAYAIPLTSARTLLDAGGTQAVTPCEQ
jgi:S1-C subfamily serine protease